MACFGLLVSYSPRYFARYLIGSELDAIGIDHDGLDTLEINPWTREFWLGPVRFGAGPSDQGQIGELGLVLRFGPLFQHRVSVERLLVRGIDVVATRNPDNALSLNGIPLAHFLPPIGATDTPAEEGDVWDAGADIIELRDSRLIFRNRDGGELEVEVERLTLMDFWTWEPDNPGRFELAASVNDIQLNWAGEARPFAEHITLTIDSRTEQADVPKVVRFTGPWGLERRTGTYDARLKYALTLSKSGRMEGHTAGTIDIKAIDYERSGVFTLALEHASVDLDARYELSGSGDFLVRGDLALDLGPYESAFGDETQVGAAGGRVAVNGLEARYDTDGGLQVAGEPAIAMESIALSGPVDISVDKLLDLLVLLQSLSAPQPVTTADTGLGELSGRAVKVPSSDIKIGRLTSKVEAFSLQSTEGLLELSLEATSDLTSAEISVNQRRVVLEQVTSALERLSLASGQGRLTLSTAGSNSIATGTAVVPRGELKIGALEARVDDFDLQMRANALSTRLVGVSRAKGISGLAYAAQGVPDVRIDLGAIRAALTQGTIDVESGTLRWQASGDAAAESLAASFAQGEAGALKLARAEIRDLQANEPWRFGADALTLDGIDLSVTRSLILSALRGRTDAGTEAAPSKDAPADLSTEKPTSSPEAGETKVDVRRVQTLLRDLGYAPGPIDGLMGRQTAAAISAFQAQANLAVDGRLSSRLLAALEAPGSSGPQAKIPGSAIPPARLGRITFTGEPILRFRDDMITPNVKIETIFKELEIQELNTGQADGRARLKLDAEIDEVTRLEIAGWITELTETADLEAKATAENLQLSNYAPYVAELAGVQLDSGRLDVSTDANAKKGGLQGEIRLKLADMAFQPLSKADAERVTETLGVSLETAIDLLADLDGRITLALPITGTLSEPDVDIGPAVRKAIGGALTKVFPPTLVASMVASLAKGGGPTFASIEFAPGSAELGETGKRYAEGFAKLLSEHPHLSLKLCGRATAQDLDTVAGAARRQLQRATDETGKVPVLDRASAEQALSELAKERERNLHRFLVKEKHVDAERLSECRSTFDGADHGKPRVEIHP